MSGKRIDLAKIVGLDKDGVERRMRRVALVVQAAWKAKARALGSTRAEYTSHIFPDVTGEAGHRKAVVVLTGVIPNMVEQGMGPGGVGTQGSYDQRKFVLKPGTKSLRRTKSGALYVNIPFRTAGSTVRSIGGAQALKRANQLKPSLTRVGGGKTIWGEHFRGGGFLAGLTRMQKVYSAGSKRQGVHQHYFMRWRVMSQRGKPWITKGIKARRFAAQVVSELPALLKGVL